MSVLLEALKKAAAEKKKALDSPADSSMVISDSNKVPETAVPSVLKLSTEDILPISSIDESSSSTVEDEVKAEAGLNFTLSDMSSPASIPEEFDQQELGSDVSQSSTLLESSDMTSDDSQQSAVDSTLLLKQDPPQVLQPSVQTDGLSQDLFQVTPSIFSESEIQDSPNVGSHEVFETDKDSFEWSMNALPGYSTASADDSVPIEKNSILLTGALTSQPKAKKKIHSSWLLVLMVALLFIGISVYGLIYYQEQNEQLENSMRKYELAKIQVSLPKKAPSVATVVDSSLPEAKDSINEIDSTSIVATAESNQASAVQTSKPMPGNIVAPVVHNELPASVVKTSSQGVPKSKIRHDSTNKKAAASISKPVYQPVLVKVNKTKIALSEAYRAYEAGDLEFSQQKFSEALSTDSKNITAMIGLGGVAASSEQYHVAMDYYQKALNVDPNSLVVYEAIANLSSNIELNSDWSDSLKNMVTVYPNSATLHYALGNLYASSNDWLAAQESYFNAYAQDMSNPDFIVNLAISLDQLGKYPLAGQYYTQALALAGSNTVNFNVTDIKNRLVSIRQFMDQEK